MAYHLIHACQIDPHGLPTTDTFIGMCGAERAVYPIPGPDEEKCEDCLALIGTEVTCPACGHTDDWGEDRIEEGM